MDLLLVVLAECKLVDCVSLKACDKAPVSRLILHLLLPFVLNLFHFPSHAIHGGRPQHLVLGLRYLVILL